MLDIIRISWDIIINALPKRPAHPFPAESGLFLTFPALPLSPRRRIRRRQLDLLPSHMYSPRSIEPSPSPRLCLHLSLCLRLCLSPSCCPTSPSPSFSFSPTSPPTFHIISPIHRPPSSPTAPMFTPLKIRRWQFGGKPRLCRKGCLRGVHFLGTRWWRLHAAHAKG